VPSEGCVEQRVGNGHEVVVGLHALPPALGDRPVASMCADERSDHGGDGVGVPAHTNGVGHRSRVGVQMSQSDTQGCGHGLDCGDAVAEGTPDDGRVDRAGTGRGRPRRRLPAAVSRPGSTGAEWRSRARGSWRVHDGGDAHQADVPPGPTQAAATLPWGAGHDEPPQSRGCEWLRGNSLKWLTARLAVCETRRMAAPSGGPERQPWPARTRAAARAARPPRRRP
jgi:hypothetical protein